ncbi:hypothetical protein HOLleu_35637 [Holothuria leucospilota]|uniref:Integrase catalytic domain-containing protein n=1 Tax=Holothuria leucospilota TaxID=206669 RepID=A0A9Q1BD31_HOLLE|nr:hypothetical protein HOLleu_35637 [Holothuria leucospilota]
MTKGNSKRRGRSVSITDNWTDQCEKAFDDLKEKLSSAPVLIYADLSLPFVVTTDASRQGIGAVLYQKKDGQLHPVAYGSRSLSKSERNYPAHKLEFLCLKWAVCNKFKDYLYHAKNTLVYTDNNPLTYIFTSAKLDAVGQRWLADLTNYDLSIQYRSGKTNVESDALSRRPYDDVDYQDSVDSDKLMNLCNNTKERTDGENPIPISVVSAALNVCKVGVTRGSVGNNLQLEDPWVLSLSTSAGAIPDSYSEGVDMPSYNHDWKTLQEQDPDIAQMRAWVSQGNRPSSTTDLTRDLKLMMRDFSKFCLVDDVLLRKSWDSKKEVDKYQLVLPERYRRDIFVELHDKCGHMGQERTVAAVQMRFYWPGMTSQICEWIRHCSRCVARKTLPSVAAPMGNIKTTAPMELVCIDFLSLEPDRSGANSILVITDHYTRYAQAYATRNQTAFTVAKILWDNYFKHYGLPQKLHSDRGANFESKLIAELTKMLGVRKTHTTPYHPQGDPQPERFNRTLLDMLGTLEQDEKPNWSKHLSAMVHAYNSTINSATGYSPYYLLFGREARLAVDSKYGVSPDRYSHREHYKYVSDLKSSLQKAYQLAEDKSGKKAIYNKNLYDSKADDQSSQKKLEKMSKGKRAAKIPESTVLQSDTSSESEDSEDEIEVLNMPCCGREITQDIGHQGLNPEAEVFQPSHLSTVKEQDTCIGSLEQLPSRLQEDSTLKLTENVKGDLDGCETVDMTENVREGSDVSECGSPAEYVRESDNMSRIDDSSKGQTPLPVDSNEQNMSEVVGDETSEVTEQTIGLPNEPVLESEGCDTVECEALEMQSADSEGSPLEPNKKNGECDQSRNSESRNDGDDTKTYHEEPIIDNSRDAEVDDAVEAKPRRERRPPARLVYDKLGTPGYALKNANSKRIGMFTALKESLLSNGHEYKNVALGTMHFGRGECNAL